MTNGMTRGTAAETTFPSEDEAGAIDVALEGWIGGGRVVAQKDHPAYRERRVVVETDHGYSLYRAFPLGADMAVSVDVNDVGRDEIIRHLLENAK